MIMASRKKVPVRGGYGRLLNEIGKAIEQARKNAVAVVNNELVKANWLIGKHIVQYEQQGKERAEYGSDLLANISVDLRKRYGKGFGRRNVLDMRRFFLAFPSWKALPAKLSWSHYVVLLGISDVSARTFYLRQCVNESWGYRELERQVSTALYERLALRKDKRGMLRLAKRGNVVRNPKEAVKDPYVLDFLGLRHVRQLTEKRLEQRIIDNLQMFLLELGKGFAFVSRQFAISIRNNHFYIDLVFYHRILRCFVLFDLKTRPVRHSDIGQMNLYLNYFKAEENAAGDQDPIGIILSADKDEILVEYAMGGISSRIFVSKYQLYLPDKKELQSKIKEIMNSSKQDSCE
jgi:predicted nuclease of restriction endonuclease-like (RecB) superfamily